MNIPSHHQMNFFDALQQRSQIDIQVRYYDKIPQTRKKLGWNEIDDLPEYQYSVNGYKVNQALDTLPDWLESIHIIPGFSHPFLKELLSVLIKKKVKWIHWSERSGKPFTKLLNYNYAIVNLLLPLYHNLKGYRKYAFKINKYALGAFAISSLGRADFMKWGVNDKKIKILNYSLSPLAKEGKIDISLITEEKDEKFFIYIGSLTKHKGIEELIKAYAALKRRKGWMLILVGNDHSKGAYKKLVDRLGLKNKILFTGAVNINSINGYLNSSDVFVLPTLFDGWGAVLNEAASLKKPLISTDQCGAAYHLIKDNKNGFMVKAKSVIELQLAMQFYIDNPTFIKVHGKESFNIFKNCTPELNAQLFEESMNEFASRIKSNIA